MPDLLERTLSPIPSAYRPAEQRLRQIPAEAVRGHRGWLPGLARKRCKKQLRFDEAERFLSAGFRMFDENDDLMALSAVTALLLGCRASEVLHVSVRDLDCNGTRLYIAAQDRGYGGQTQKATRSPDVLRPRLHA